MITKQEYPMLRRPITPRRIKRVVTLLGAILFFLISTRFGFALRPSEDNVRTALNDTFDPLLLPDLEIDAIYGSALERSVIVFYHTDTGYGWRRMKPQLLNWIIVPDDGGGQRRVLMQTDVVHQHERLRLGRRQARLLFGQTKLTSAIALIVKLDDGRSVRSPVSDGVFNQLIAAPRTLCAMQIVDASNAVLYRESLDDAPECDRPSSPPES
jgi:hypothetical protein